MNNIIQLRDKQPEGTSTAQRLRTTVSDRYKTVETKRLIERLESSFPTQLDMKHGKITRGSGTIHSLVLPINTETTMRGDIIQPNINIINSYNGECALQLDIGFTRLVCFNGMRIGSSLFNRKVRHISGQKIDDFLRNFESNVADTLGAVDAEVKRVEQLSSTNITPTQVHLIIEKLRKAGVITNDAAWYTSYIYSNDRFRRDADRAQSHTIFGLWNVFNEELERSRTSRTTDFTLLKRNDKLLPAILLAAEEVA